MTQIIAEIGWNHMGDMNLAKEMVSAAHENGADFVKFQTWSVSRLKDGPWDVDGRREIYNKAELSLDQHLHLKEYCDTLGIKFFSSVFSLADAELLASVETEYVKIASFDARNKDLLSHVTTVFDKVFVSTGTCSISEVKESMCRVKRNRLVLFHCVSSYPLLPSNANLPRLNALKSLAPSIGYSDHTQGVEVTKVALEFDIDYIEKHFTIDHSLPGRDNKFAILPHELKDLSDYTKLRDESLVDHGGGFLSCEQEARDVQTGRFNG